MRVPILTDRQFEILELLAVGATRQEIASELGISPETVKVHTKTIIDKFDATSVRDAMVDINNYLAAFGRDGSGLTSYFHSICGTIDVASDYRSSFKTWVTYETIVRGPVTEILSMVHEEGVVSKVLLNGVKPELEKTDVKSAVVRLELDKALAAGDEFRRELSYRSEFIGIERIDNYSITIKSPVEYVSLLARFDDGIPQRWDVVLQKGFLITELIAGSKYTIEHGNNFIQVGLRHLSAGETYIIRWSA
jgi:DNA-binding CsgD family transcriptional regulator